jgi:hypothetical protein
MIPIPTNNSVVRGRFSVIVPDGGSTDATEGTRDYP